VLVWNKNVIIFSLYFDINHNTKTGEIERTWKILKILAPKGLEESNEEIIAMIKEALIAYYFLPVEKRHNAQFFFEFKTNPQYVLECHEYNSEGLWNRL